MFVFHFSVVVVAGGMGNRGLDRRIGGLCAEDDVLTTGENAVCSVNNGPVTLSTASCSLITILASR